MIYLLATELIRDIRIHVHLTKHKIGLVGSMGLSDLFGYVCTQCYPHTSVRVDLTLSELEIRAQLNEQRFLWAMSQNSLESTSNSVIHAGVIRDAQSRLDFLHNLNCVPVPPPPTSGNFTAGVSRYDKILEIAKEPIRENPNIILPQDIPPGWENS